jgi:hypothetical protein
MDARLVLSAHIPDQADRIRTVSNRVFPPGNANPAGENGGICTGVRATRRDRIVVFGAFSILQNEKLVNERNASNPQIDGSVRSPVAVACCCQHMTPRQMKEELGEAICICLKSAVFCLLVIIAVSQRQKANQQLSSNCFSVRVVRPSIAKQADARISIGPWKSRR